MPLVLSVCGGVALVLAFGTLFGLQPRALPTLMANAEIDVTPAAAEPRAEPEPARAAAAGPEGSPAEEPALVTALPDAPTTGAGEAILEPIVPQPQAAADAVVPDPDPTAAIPPALPAQITAFAPRPRPAGPGERPARNDDGDAPAAPATGQPEPARNGAAMRAATVRQAVNLRAAPDKNGQVVTVVPASAQIEAEANCGWCEISYQGRTGFIYKSFIDYR